MTLYIHKNATGACNGSRWRDAYRHMPALTVIGANYREAGPLLSAWLRVWCPLIRFVAAFFCMTLLCSASVQSPKGANQTSTAGAQMVRTAAVAPAGRTVTLFWTYPTNRQTADLVFRIRGSPYVTTPVTLWPVVATVPGDLRSVQIPATNTQGFFTLTASNFLGQSNYATK